MTKREMVISALESLGYKPTIDDDGDVMLHYQMKLIYVLGVQHEDVSSLAVVFPQFYEIDEGDEIKTLTVCNKLTRDVTLAKLYIDRNLTDVTASCEFFYCDEECLRSQLEHALDIIGQVRSAFHRAMREFDE